LGTKNVSTRVLLVDDSPDLLRSTARFLSISGDVDVIGCASSSSEALEEVGRLHPDLVLIDVGITDMNGIEATRRIKAGPDPPLVVVTTFYDESRYRAKAKAAGADAVVAKPELGTRLLPIIRALTSTGPGGPGVPEGEEGPE
jgi:DNA-binding NarL/FixJ family response regulator